MMAKAAIVRHHNWDPAAVPYRAVSAHRSQMTRGSTGSRVTTKYSDCANCHHSRAEHEAGGGRCSGRVLDRKGRDTGKCMCRMFVERQQG